MLSGRGHIINARYHCQSPHKKHSAQNRVVIKQIRAQSGGISDFQRNISLKNELLIGAIGGAQGQFYPPWIHFIRYTYARN